MCSIFYKKEIIDKIGGVFKIIKCWSGINECIVWKS